MARFSLRGTLEGVKPLLCTVQLVAAGRDLSTWRATTPSLGAGVAFCSVQLSPLARDDCVGETAQRLLRDAGCARCAPISRFAPGSCGISALSGSQLAMDLESLPSPRACWRDLENFTGPHRPNSLLFGFKPAVLKNELPIGLQRPSWPGIESSSVIFQVRLSVYSTNPLMVVSLAAAILRMRWDSSLEQQRSSVVLGPKGRIEKLGSILGSASHASRPSHISSYSTALITVLSA